VQKVVVVRGSLDGAGGWARSYEVDAPSGRGEAPLRDLLAKGWRVSRACPMPSELEACCLLVLDEPSDTGADARSAERHPVARAIHNDGYTTGRRPGTAIDDDLPLSLFGIDH
jgi:hypothetical protein